MLRAEGHEVYDFRNPAEGDIGFGWHQCAPEGTDRAAFRDMMQDPAFFRDEVLTHPIARDGFSKDWHALTWAEATVLVLPCGRSAHLELGVATGRQQRTIVYLDDPMSEPELMYLACTKICVSLAEVVHALRPAADEDPREVGLVAPSRRIQVQRVRTAGTTERT
ncbi:MAG: hypothetical protein ACHP7H_00755 [Hyphomicrobiales bacterium]